MWQWVMANLSTILVLVVLGLIVGGIVAGMIHSKRTGKSACSGCSGSCAGCSGHCGATRT